MTRLGHFLLHQEDAAFQPGARRNGARQDGRRDIVRQVPGHYGRPPLVQVGCEDIGRDDLQAWVREPLPKQCCEILVQLDGNYPVGAGQQALGQRALTRANLDHERHTVRTSSRGDTLQDGPFGEEVLAEPLPAQISP